MSEKRVVTHCDWCASKLAEPVEVPKKDCWLIYCENCNCGHLDVSQWKNKDKGKSNE